jgi:hypothetical protein
LDIKVKRLVIAAAAIISISALVAPTWANEDLASLARSTARGPLAAESVYFVMTDRFENGDKSNDGGGLTGGRLGGGDDPTDIA